MDEEIEKPFPIEFIVILMIIAIANDVAEIFFDLLDFTGVGLAGEGVMEPANLVLDFFFTGVFWWKVGPGGGTITQYIGDLLEPLLIPARTISVGAGLWIANHPDSAIGQAANTAASLESGNVGGVEGEAEKVAGTAEKEATNAEKKLESGNVDREGESKTIRSGSSSEAPKATSPEGENNTDNEAAPANDIFKNPYDNPVGTAQEQVFNPSEDAIQEGRGFGAGGKPKEEDVQHSRGIHLVDRRPPAPPKQNQPENTAGRELNQAA